MTLSYRMYHSLLVAVAVSCTVLFVGTPSQALAYNSDEALERDGALCTRQVTRSERKYGIPSKLLGAMAATETGRRHKGLGIQVPWPWTINVEGKPYFFDSKSEVVAAVQKFQAQGITSIDVGCMQINLHHHPDAFANLNQAFEPRFNVDYAARFLRGHYDDTRSWKMAVGRYHSRTPGHAARYIGVVYSQWYGLTNKVASRNSGSKKRYKSYLRMEKSGEQVVFNKVSAPKNVVTADTPKDNHVVAPNKARHANNDYQMSIIRPASSAGKIQSAPTQGTEDASGPIVMSMGEAKSFTTPKVVSISANGKTSSRHDGRFIRFAD